MRFALSVVAGIVGVMLVSGCGDDDGGNPFDAAYPDVPGLDVRVTVDAGTRAVTGRVLTLEKQPAAGMRVCPFVGEEADCVTTDASGMATVEIGLTDTQAVRITGTGFADEIAMVELGETERFLGLQLPAATRDGIIAGVMTADPNMGHALVIASATEAGAPPPLAGFTYALEEAAGERAYYMNEGLVPNQSLEATTANGSGVFVNVAPGGHSFAYVPAEANSTCDVIAPAGAGLFDIVIEAGSVTYVPLVECHYLD